MNNDELLIVIKDIFDNKTDEIKQYVDIKINGQSTLIESLRSDIKAVAEGHDIIDRKVDETKKELKGLIDETRKELKGEVRDLKSI